ncbi:MAG: hypothetical protein HQK76_12610 [Desulfobacterales bacterium]|nr:hypothetical protein [Desulfobacterales bacterium]
MTHHHNHEETKNSLSFEEKLIKLFEHWIKHNKDHAGNYKEWADKAKEKGLNEITSLLESAAEKNNEINIILEKGLNIL